MSTETQKVDVKSFFQDLLCYLSNQEDLAGFEIQQTQQVMDAVDDVIEALTWAVNNSSDDAYWIGQARMALACIGGDV